jgi:NADPH:quinone reductase-like Zn-dependent oxidoreductase
MLQSIGADHLIDYTTEDFRQNGVVYDVIFDVVGTLSLSGCAASLTPDGTYLLANPLRGQMTRGPWYRWRTSHEVVMQTASGTVDDLVYLRELVEKEQLKTVIDRRYPLEEIVEAHRYVETGAKMGNVVITISSENNAVEEG